MGLFDLLFGLSEEDKSKKNNSIYSESELNSFGLSEQEKSEVRKGNQDPWDFEEDEKEEDDYYSEDDE